VVAGDFQPIFSTATCNISSLLPIGKHRTGRANVKSGLNYDVECHHVIIFKLCEYRSSDRYKTNATSMLPQMQLQNRATASDEVNAVTAGRFVGVGRSSNSLFFNRSIGLLLCLFTISSSDIDVPTIIHIQNQRAYAL
jgi:hypothetical protein